MMKAEFHALEQVAIINYAVTRRSYRRLNRVPTTGIRIIIEGLFHTIFTIPSSRTGRSWARPPKSPHRNLSGQAASPRKNQVRCWLRIRNCYTPGLWRLKEEETFEKTEGVHREGFAALSPYGRQPSSPRPSSFRGRRPYHPQGDP